jgi:hypothetical protein
VGEVVTRDRVPGRAPGELTGWALHLDTPTRQLTNPDLLDRRADLMHPSRLAEPMGWLLDRPGRLRMECTGFGLKVVNGNYELPG